MIQAPVGDSSSYYDGRHRVEARANSGVQFWQEKTVERKARRRQRSVRMLVVIASLCVTLPGCAIQQHQRDRDAADFEVALERGRELDQMLIRLMEAIDASAWEAFPPPGHKPTDASAPIAHAAPCPASPEGDHFMFAAWNKTEGTRQWFKNTSLRDRAIQRAESFFRSEGLKVSREMQSGDALIWGASDDLVMAARFDENGVAMVTAETSCSSEWPNFSLKRDRFNWLYFKRFTEETLQVP